MMAVAALALTGCAGVVLPPSLSANSPASPEALEGSYPAAMPRLMTGTNFAMSPQADEQPTPGHGEMKMDKPTPDKPHDHNSPNP